MDSRKELILKILIQEHIKTGTPVGSGVLVEKYNLDISPATARNELAWLESEGYIIQPHTSAGRVPTEKAYNLFLEQFSNSKLSKQITDHFCSVLQNTDEQSLKETAKVTARISDGAVFCAFHRNNLYYTGISNLFQQPEFNELSLIHDISTVIDRMDEVIDSIFDEIDIGVHTLIGSKNPFGNFCSVIISKHRTEDNVGLFGVLGPMRMDYKKNIALIKYINKKISN
ncbi:hypothetical protein A2331_02835 [Candidatus Falkowbacteria bacterium RIFOXYB2_FULL_34_18]|uniref:Heat-inducible transcription repressor HrcA C-terminal domain-containing protein n=1 Tax=Candidatus Falkowbacteria bacterium RIFOXYD2_FULL_34_120 TaxID=1798007 RepID=A0A1F5TMB4_9BACT|nr:MAG: hypothetical protein A2331_02835 [Candidatus Falkowbacteria bacterium RIFOXYB2_FULL_34_18]OGF28353.1 MAG: hypothetical protein A2500_03105 [Candidatus Falkowbacteria bacterium RIFOXYC12_FULL_34_55]OGF37928.1 MAG: hypothetical protein A2466_05980 [Candidatus Falkowbacteria bacterium RIFOXYC2_FULL_34_220]OGF39646.1 MAG: hypothetical protein A2515_07275 [Candidatus Falkowbacteria bacterium RIFOXYD12_FULL_34_57]OGF40085.1 MAG: hypothetical protein A2531_04970 [Candidatus Falkowbacteria bact